MTAPDKIWTAPTDGKCHVGFDTKSMNYTIEYTRTDLAQAAVAAAYEAAAKVVASHAVIAARMNQDQANSLLRSSEAAIRALATTDQIAALAADRAKLKLIKTAAQQSFAYARDARPAGYEAAILKIEALLEVALAEIRGAK